MRRRMVAWLLSLTTLTSDLRVAVAGVERAQVPSVGELTLEEVVRSVETNYPLLRAASFDRAIASADQLSAEGGFDPALRARATTIPLGGYPNDRFEVGIEQPTGLWGTRLFGGYRYGQGSFAPYDGKLETADRGEVRVGAQVPLWRDGPIDRRRASMARAEIGTRVADLSVEEQRLVMVRAASFRYWEWVAAGKKVSIAEALLATATTRDAQLAARVEKGDLPAYERSENLRALHQREAQVTALERTLDNAAIELSLFLMRDGAGSVVPDRARLPKSLPPLFEVGQFSATRSERLAASSRPEPQRLEAMSAQTRIDRELAANQRKPAIDILVAGAKDLGSGPPKIVPGELEISLILEIPILTRVQEGRQRAAEAQLSKLGEQARYARERVTADVRDALSAIDRARERAQEIKREIDVARGLVVSERERFELGDSSLLMVNLREQALAEAELREVDAVLEHHRGVAALRASVGRGSP